jgi:outer membrane protein OmpA-like peptidoglycan-associated protein
MTVATNVAVGLVLGLMIGCSSQATDRVSEAKPLVGVREAWRVEQTNFAERAMYALCQEPACPMRTAKTAGVAVRTGQNLTVAAPRRTSSPAPAEVVVTFEFNDSRLSEEARSILLAALPSAKQADKIFINGRTDSLGRKPENDRLALARAEATRAFLVQMMPALADRFVVEANGACCYVADNDTTDGQARNRRVEIEVSKRVE